MSRDYEQEANIRNLARLVLQEPLIDSDFADVDAVNVKGRDFPQQPGGAGVQITFTVSWHALGKRGAELNAALDKVFPDGGDD